MSCIRQYFICSINREKKKNIYIYIYIYTFNSKFISKKRLENI